MSSFDFAVFVTLATAPKAVAKPCAACKAPSLTILDFNNSAQGMAATAALVSPQAKQFAGMLTNQRKAALCACCWNRAWEAKLALDAAKASHATAPAKVRKPRAKKVVATPAF